MFPNIQKKLSARGKVKAFSHIVDHYEQRFMSKQVYNKGCIAITSFAAFSSSPISRTNTTEFSVNSRYTRSRWGTRRCATKLLLKTKKIKKISKWYFTEINNHITKELRALQFSQKFEIFVKVLSWLDDVFFNSYQSITVDAKTLSCHLIQVNVVLKWSIQKHVFLLSIVIQVVLKVHASLRE